VYAALTRYNTQGSHADLPRSGRPRLSNAREDRSLILESLQNRRMTVPDLTASWNDAGVASSSSSVRRRLKDVGLTEHVAH
jgi:transposase